MILGPVLAAAVAAAAASAQAGDPDARAAAVERQMTDAERLTILSGVMPINIPGMPTVEVPPGVPAIAGLVMGVERLGVPRLLETDASLGVANPLQMREDEGTAMPSGLALASTFDPAIARQAGATVGSEVRAKGFNVLLGGGINLTRDPRNGRNFEYLGEDPLLAGRMGGAHIAGVQSQRVVSTVKHLVLNGQETQRHTADSVIEEAALRESDLLAFQFAIEDGRPGSVMCAYNLVNGAESCGSDFLLNKVLKGDWKYPGWVLSDWGAVDDVSYFMNGLDQQSGAQLDKERWFGEPLKAEIAAGRVPAARVSDAVRRILRSLYAVGADTLSPPTKIDYPANAKVSLAAAQQGIVLLKNDGVLPLAATARSILVVGGQAEFGVLSGGGSSQVTPANGPPRILPLGMEGQMNAFARELYMPSSPLAALKAALPQATIGFDPGYSVSATAAAAAKADLVIVFATKWEGEGFDSPDLSLPRGQDDLIAALADANRNVVVVLETGNPVTMPWLADVRAVVEAWYPGQEGGQAIADILTGKVNPAGRLPITFPASLDQLPRRDLPGLGLPERTPIKVAYTEGADIGYRYFARTGLKPLFPFGYGLSYTRFEHGPLTLTGGRSVTATFTVRNTGQRDGVDTPQLYLVNQAGEPLQRLAGFSRVPLKPGETATVTLTVDPRLLADWTGGGWTVRGGEYGFAVGASAADLGPTARVNVTAAKLAP